MEITEVKDKRYKTREIKDKIETKQETNELIQGLLQNNLVLNWARKMGIREVKTELNGQYDSMGVKPNNNSIGIMSDDASTALVTNAELKADFQAHTAVSIDKLRKALSLIPNSYDSGCLIINSQKEMPVLLAHEKNVLVIAPRILEESDY